MAIPKHKCENCGVEVEWKGSKQRFERCRGWVGSMPSKHGKTYDKRRGLAWWCPAPSCQRAMNRTTLEKVLPDTVQVEAMLDEIELEKLNRN